MGYEGAGGKWTSDKNRIYFGSLTDYQNFNKITIKTTMYNGTLYYVLIRNCDSFAPSNYVVPVGDVYRYVSGGERLNSDVLFFFTALEFEQIFHLDKKTKTIYSFRTYDKSTTSRGKSDFSKLSNHLIKEDKIKTKDFMNIRIADDGEMVRFLLPYQRDETWEKEFDVFPICYFEMPLKDFYKWLEPVSPIAK